MSHLLNSLLRAFHNHGGAGGAIVTKGFLFPSMTVAPLPLRSNAAGPAGRRNPSAFPALI
jgi:hypothetical protein